MLKSFPVNVCVRTFGVGVGVGGLGVGVAVVPVVSPAPQPDNSAITNNMVVPNKMCQCVSFLEKITVEQSFR